MSNNEVSHIADGISQIERYLAALRPNYFKIEEREKEDLLKFIVEISKHFNFYNLNNEIDGSWQDFLIADIDIILLVLPKFSINNYIKEYDKLKNNVLIAQNDRSSIENLSQLMVYLDDFITFQDTIHNKFRFSSRTNSNILEFRQLVNDYDVFEAELGLLKKYMFQANLYFGDYYSVPENRKLTEVELREFYSNPEYALDDKHVKVHVNNLLPKLDQIFYGLRSKYNRLTEATELYLHKQKQTKSTYEPHIALILTFLELYQFLKTDINSITKKHLDFYYNNVLDLKYKAPIPDSVYLLFKLNSNAVSYNLERGEILTVKSPDGVEVSQFQTNHDLLITGATIKKLRTLYVSDVVKIPSKDDINSDVRELQVFVSSFPVFEPSDFLVDNAVSETWPLLGEDQVELSSEERSMNVADLGLIMASPLLYAKDGRRNFSIRFLISKASANSFKEHVDKYALLTGLNQKVLIFEMLSKAFHISLTSASGWFEVKKYTASFNGEPDADNFIDFDFELIHTDPSIVNYQRELHEFEYQTNWPVIRFMLNANSFHSPYTFLKDISFQRISIKLSVTDSEQFKMQNNIGVVSTSNPFQLFGPQASIGSFFDIKNANIFNCYTKDFAIKLDWFDLPREKGGFNSYYHSYKPVIGNESFIISISGLNEGKFQPPLEDQQTFKLFEMLDEPGKKDFLSKCTIVEDIDFSKIHFDNIPSHSLEETVAEIDFKEGAIRLELISPEEGFGNKIYPSLFSEVIINNSRMFTKKAPVPNPPYTAIVRKITINYILEHSEIISGINNGNEQMHNLQLWHQDTFGFKNIYPSNGADLIGFVPSIKHQSNLFIGLENVPEKQVLSLFFQIEENSFQNSGYEVDHIQWSLLQNNKWQNLSKSDVLLDETLNFIKSGIVKLFIPELSAGINTIMDSNLLWLKASSNKRGDIRTKVKAIFSQCISATRNLRLEDSANQQLVLLPGSIQELHRKIPQIQNVWQPFASFGGQLKESEDKYYVRISERLRHKQRPITTTDIAQLVLEEFPEILKVFCYGIGNNNKMMMPGYDVQVIVIPRQSITSFTSSAEPKVALAELVKIKNYISDKISENIKIDVANPVYERVKIVCKIMFNKSYSKSSIGNNIIKLNNDLKRFITPWMFFAETDIKMDGKLYLSEILNFVKNLPYISHVTSFSVLHFFNKYNPVTGKMEAHVIDTAVDSVKYIKGSNPGAILVSAPSHEITILEDKNYEKPGKTGIGGLVISDEFLVDKHGEVEPEFHNADDKYDNEDEFDFYFNPKI